MEQSYEHPLDMRGLKFIYYGMLLGLAAFLFTGTINLIISFGKFIVMIYGLYHLCKTDLCYRAPWNWCWACTTFSLIDLGITLWFIFTQHMYPWWLLVIMSIGGTVLYVLYIRALCKSTAIISRQTGQNAQVEPIIWSRWRWLWISQAVYIIAYIVYAIGIRFSLFNIAMIVQLMSVVTLFVMTWVIAMFNACFLALNNQYRIYPEYGTPSLTDGKKKK
ncbi:MAG: hypothetical protein ACLUVV_06065 [Christensenellales bacterium]